MDLGHRVGITTWDERLEEMHGLPPGGFGGTFEDWVAALHPFDRAECIALVEAALTNPGPYRLVHRTIWADGSEHVIECRGTVLTDSAGHPTGTTGVAIDVTTREQRAAAVSAALADERQLYRRSSRCCYRRRCRRCRGQRWPPDTERRRRMPRLVAIGTRS